MEMVVLMGKRIYERALRVSVPTGRKFCFQFREARHIVILAEAEIVYSINEVGI